MAQTKQIDISSATIRLKAIEMLNGIQTFPFEQQNKQMIAFNFNVNIENTVNAEEKLIFSIITVDITDDEEPAVLYGSLTISCIFEIKDFDTAIKFNRDGIGEIPQPLADAFNTVSISTMRGIMFSTFKGTFLHNAFLPLIDLQSFQRMETK